MSHVQFVHGTSYLVGRVVASLVPNVKVLVRKVQRPRGILLDAPVQRLNTLATLTVGCILQELQACSTEAVLLLENGLVGQGHLNRSVLVSIEARRLVRKLENLAPLDVIALDVVGVEDGVGRVRVEEGGRGVERNTAVEDDLTLWLRAGLQMRSSQDGRGHCGQRYNCLCVHGVW